MFLHRVHRLENKLQEAGQNLSQMRAQLQQQHNSANQSAELAKRVRRKMNLFQKVRKHTVTASDLLTVGKRNLQQHCVAILSSVICLFQRK